MRGRQDVATATEYRERRRRCNQSIDLRIDDVGRLICRDVADPDVRLSQLPPQAAHLQRVQLAPLVRRELNPLALELPSNGLQQSHVWVGRPRAQGGDVRVPSIPLGRRTITVRAHRSNGRWPIQFSKM